MADMAAMAGLLDVPEDVVLGSILPCLGWHDWLSLRTSCRAFAHLPGPARPAWAGPCRCHGRPCAAGRVLAEDVSQAGHEGCLRDGEAIAPHQAARHGHNELARKAYAGRLPSEVVVIAAGAGNMELFWPLAEQHKSILAFAHRWALVCQLLGNGAPPAEVRRYAAPDGILPSAEAVLFALGRWQRLDLFEVWPETLQCLGLLTPKMSHQAHLLSCLTPGLFKAMQPRLPPFKLGPWGRAGMGAPQPAPAPGCLGRLVRGCRQPGDAYNVDVLAAGLAAGGLYPALREVLAATGQCRLPLLEGVRMDRQCPELDSIVQEAGVYARDDEDEVEIWIGMVLAPLGEQSMAAVPPNNRGTEDPLRMVARLEPLENMCLAFRRVLLQEPSIWPLETWYRSLWKEGKYRALAALHRAHAEQDPDGARRLLEAADLDQPTYTLCDARDRLLLLGLRAR